MVNRFAPTLACAAILTGLMFLAPAIRAEGIDWDFTKGVPPGGKPRKCAVIDGKGLYPSQMGDRLAKAGVEFPNAVLPEAFELEVDFVPCLEWTNAADRAVQELSGRHMMIWDSMSVNYPPSGRNKGLQVLFIYNKSAGSWTAHLYAGFGDCTRKAVGPSFKPQKGVPARLSVRFDAAGGVFWNLNGEKTEAFLGRNGAIVPDPIYRPVVGDRIGSFQNPFDGYIRRLSIRPAERGLFTVRAKGRAAFERGEKNARLRLQACCAAELSDAVLTVEERSGAESRVYSRVEKRCGAVSPGTEIAVELPVETRLAPGAASATVVLSGTLPSRRFVAQTNSVDMAIGPVFAERMPVVMWGSSSPDDVVRDFGFTHVLRYELQLRKPECSPEDEMRINKRYDAALASGMRAMHSIGMRYPDDDKARFCRVRRDGTLPKDWRGKEMTEPEVSNPELLDYARRIAALDSRLFGDHPGFAGVLPVSENRDRTNPSFRTEHLRYKAETGRDVPADVDGKTFPFAKAKKLFPDGVVQPDNPIVSYYSWFWGGGDGWPGYTGGIASEYRKVAGRFYDGSEAQRRRPFFSFWDPAVRCPPKWGSGGDVDVISQWVYAQPEPMNVAAPAEEVLAMAAGRPGQLPMIMTQIIGYRIRLAPTNVVVSPLPGWAKRFPEAKFPTLPPDALREATWSMLAKPVKGIMYHGWGCIYDTGEKKGYCYTCPESAQVLKRLLKDVVAPLGPTLKDLGRAEPEVAVLETFGNTVFSVRSGASWGWLTAPITFVQRARLDPRVIYEETIMRDGFGRTKVLYAPQCVFLSAPVVEKIREFQKAGGILVADENLLPALKADVVVPVVAQSDNLAPVSDHTDEVDAATKTRANNAARRFTEKLKSDMVANAESLRRTLVERHAYAPKADSSSAEIVVYSRQWRNTPYVFAVNDKRTFGDYVGQWGCTMDKGLPYEGTVYLSDPGRKTGAVYELSRGGEVPFSRDAKGRVSVPLAFDTTDGRLLVFLERKIASVGMEVPKAAVAPGGEIAIKMTVRDESGALVPARLPVEVRIYDAAGRELDGAGYACAVDGVCELKVATNLNDPPGGYRVVCRDRASGLSRTARVASAAK